MISFLNVYAFNIKGDDNGSTYIVETGEIESSSRTT